MHEVGIAKDLLKLTLEAAAQAQLRKVTAIEAKGHGLSSGELESVRLHWDLVTKGTAAQKSRLEIETGPVEASCLDCGWQGRSEDEKCPHCGGPDLLANAAVQLSLVSVSGE